MMMKLSRTFALCLILIVMGCALVFSQVGVDKRPTPPPKTAPRPKPRTPARTVRKSSTRNETKPSTSVPRAGSIVRNQMGMELVYVPAGMFMMGSENGGSDEKPVHQVTIREGFYMGRYEVTQAQWQQVMDNPSYKDHKVQSEVTGVLEGRVVNSQTKEPVAGATVQIINMDTQVAAFTKTDANGHFIKSLPAGRYKVTVEADKFKPYETDNEQRVFITRADQIKPNPIALEPLIIAEAMPSPSPIETPRPEVYTSLPSASPTATGGTVAPTKAEAYFKNCAQCPMESVSWNDAQEFIRKLNAMNDGFIYRLPTEAEWEYACRAGTTGDYAGNLDAMAWYLSNSGSQTHAVGTKQANGFGLYDMYGNVAEWCEDWYHENYNGASSDGSAWENGGEQKYRVLRGGSWLNYAANLRSANRDRFEPGNRFNGFGFRVVAVSRSS